MQNKGKQTRRSKDEDGMSRSRNGEGSVIKKAIGDFQAKGSKGERIIEEIFKCPIQKISTKSIVNLVQTLSLIFFKKNLKRMYTRNIILTIKWVNVNSEKIEPIIPFLHLELDKNTN